MTQHKRFDLLASVALIGLTLVFFWKILLTNLILSGVDVFLYFYPYKEYVAEALRQGRLPLWNPHLFMGAPLLANSQAGVFYPLNWLFIWLDAPRQVAWSIGLHIALAAIFMFAFTRHSLRLAWPAALLASILFGFGGYLGAQVEHINQLQAAAWLPLLFLFYDRLLAHRWLNLFILALIIALILLAGHAQTAFISLFGLGLYALWRSIFESAPPRSALSASKLPRSAAKNISSINSHYSLLIINYSLFIYNRLWPIALASLLAVALAAIQLLPTAELSGLSIRSEGLTFREVVSFSLRPTNLHYSLLPPFNLDLTQILGQAFSEWVAYLGVSGLILAILGSLISIRQPAPRRFVFVSAAGLILSLGLFTGPLYVGLYYLVPGFDLFRVPARWLLLYAFGAAVLAGYGFEALLAPAKLRTYLTAIHQWLRARPWRLLLPLAPLVFLLALVAWKTPPLLTLGSWLLLAFITFGLIFYGLRSSINIQLSNSPTTPDSQKSPPLSLSLSLSLIFLLLLLELFFAAQTLNYNHPTAPQAYSSMRNAIAFLLAADPVDRAAPPGRFLSLSGITYDPGDLADLQNIYGDYLTENALYDLVVAVKEKEVLFFNLPMLYDLHSVDGYDGGILPLAQFVTLQKLFLPADDLSIDGRLREKLRFVPDNRFLSMLNTRWIITDKQFDVWIDGIFYDLQFPAYLAPGQSISAAEIPDFPPTALGIVSHLQNAESLINGQPAAIVRLTFVDGQSQAFVLRAGVDTAEGLFSPEREISHTQAAVGVTWPYEAGGVDYVSLKTLERSQPIRSISVEAILDEGQFVLRGLSLIHQPTTTSRSVILSTAGDYRQVHSGDVKVYENRDVLPRSFIAYQAEVVQDDDQALAAMLAPDFDPNRQIVLFAANAEQIGPQFAGQPSPRDQVRIVSYTPERVELEARLASPGWLVLSDTRYPGWQATVNAQPAEILTANLLFRAVALPAGEHTVVFEFKPESFRLGVIVSSLAWLSLGVGLLIAGRRKQALP